jgi:hypothetical protein
MKKNQCTSHDCQTTLVKFKLNGEFKVVLKLEKCSQMKRDNSNVFKFKDLKPCWDEMWKGVG